MKRVLSTIILTMFCALAHAQNTAVCNFATQVSATGASAGSASYFDNRRLGCYQWEVHYSSAGFTALSIQLESAPDNGGVPGTWSAFTGSSVVVDGTNPSTVVGAALIGVHSAAAWVRLNITSVTGTGTITYIVWGANSVSVAKNGSGSSTSVKSVSATAPLTSSGGTTPVIAGTYQGNGSKIQLAGGSTPTANDCAKFDASANIVDAGAACSSGGGGSGAFVLLATYTASSVSAVVIASRNASGQSGNIFQSDYKLYQIEINNLVPATNNATLYWQVSVNSGTTWDASSNYTYSASVNYNNSTSLFSSNYNSQNQGQVSDAGCYNAAQWGCSASLRVRGALNASQIFLLQGQAYRSDSGGDQLNDNIIASNKSLQSFNAIQFYFSSGAVSSGTISVYGIGQ